MFAVGPSGRSDNCVATITAATARNHRLVPLATRNQLTIRRMSRDPTAAPPSESVMSISREEMSELPIRRYEGSVHVVAGHPDLQHALQDILQESVVGFDTETRPAFRPGENYLPSPVQFATASAVYLLQVQQQDLFGAMREILS